MFANIAKIVALLTLLPKAITAIVEAIKAFEVPGYGAQKCEAVKKAIATAFTFAEKATVDTPLTEADVTGFIDKVWAVVEWWAVAVGKFNKPAAETVPTPAPEEPAV